MRTRAVCSIIAAACEQNVPDFEHARTGSRLMQLFALYKLLLQLNVCQYDNSDCDHGWGCNYSFKSFNGDNCFN